MAERKFKATIEIGGAVAGSLKSSFAAVTGNTKVLGKTVNALNAQMKSVRAEMKKSGADTSALGKELAALESKAAATKKALDGFERLGALKIGEKLGTVMRRSAAGFTALAAAAGTAGAAVWKLGSSFGNFVDEAAETASNIDVDTNALLGFRYTAMQVGASAEMMDKALMEMNLRLADAKDEGSEAGAAIRELGIDVDELLKLDTASRFATISEAFKNYTGAVSKAKLATNMMGKAGRKMPNVLNLGREGLNKMMADAKAAGMLLSEADEKMGDAFDTQMGFLKAAFIGARNTIGREILPSITAVVTELTNTVIENLPQIKSAAQEFGAWLKSNGPVIAGQIKDVAVSLVQLARDAAPVIERLGGLKFVVGALAAAAFAPAIASIASLGVALIGAVPAIVTITTGLWGMAAAAAGGSAALLPIIGVAALVVAGVAAIGYAVWHVIENWDIWKAAIDELWGKLSGFGTSLVEWVGTTSQAFADFGAGIYNSIVGAFDSVTAKVGAWFDWIKGKLSSVGSSISGLFSFGGGSETPDGARAKGGPVRRGGSYLVGEKGPELFTPKQSGTIIPSNETRQILSRSHDYPTQPQVSMAAPEIPQPIIKTVVPEIAIPQPQVSMAAPNGISDAMKSLPGIVAGMLKRAFIPQPSEPRILPAPFDTGSVTNETDNRKSADNRTYNITINAAPGMNERSIADLVMARLDGRQAALAGGALYD